MRPREDPDSIPGKNSNWKGKLNYVQKWLVSFSDNREGGFPWETKKKKKMPTNFLLND